MAQFTVWLLTFTIALSVSTGHPSLDSGALRNSLDCPPLTYKCPYDDFCITADQLCDGVPDCIGGADEDGDAPECCQFSFRCPQGRCIRSSYVCDGQNDCNDWSDENQNCTGTTVTPCHGFHC